LLKRLGMHPKLDGCSATEHNAPQRRKCLNDYDCGHGNCATQLRTAATAARKMRFGFRLQGLQTCSWQQELCRLPLLRCEAGLCNNDLDCQSCRNALTPRTDASALGLLRNDIDCRHGIVQLPDSYMCRKEGQMRQRFRLPVLQTCDPVSHYCRTESGFCNSDADCGTWQACDKGSGNASLKQARAEATLTAEQTKGAI